MPISFASAFDNRALATIVEPGTPKARVEYADTFANAKYSSLQILDIGALPKRELPLLSGFVAYSAL